MPQWLVASLALLFFIHLAAFGRLAIRRGGVYYWLLTALFLALTASFAIRLVGPQWHLAGQPLYLLLRYAAWGMAAVTLPILVMRLLRRRRSRIDLAADAD